MTFEAMGIDRKRVQAAIEKTKELSETDIPEGRKPSRSTYVLCPIDRTLWDLKIVVQFAIEDVPKELKPKPGWVTRKFEPDLQRLGFDVIKFAEEKRRELGVRGFAPQELNGRHTVNWANGSEQEGGLSAAQEKSANLAGRRLVNSNQFVRNPILVREVRARAKGRCESCEERTFQTDSGEWFLEVHHKVWLSEGGADEPSNMIALCPNCHRREHFGVERKYGL